MKITIFPLPLLLLVLLSACAATEAGEAPYYFGSAVRQNIAAQVVRPEGAPAGAALGFDGERAQLAQKRYQQNAVEKAVAPKTSATITSGGQ